MKLPEKPDKPIIMGHVLRFMNQFRPGDIVHSIEIYHYVKRNMNGKRLDDTPGRYLRELRKQGKLNYTCVHKQKGKFKIIPIGDSHSL